MDKAINISIEDVSIYAYHKATQGDLSYLKKYGNEEEVFQELISQFNEFNGSGENKLLWNTKLQVERLRTKILYAQSVLKILYFGALDDEDKTKLITLLKKDKIVYSEGTQEEYEKNFKYLKALENKLTLKSKELEALIPKENSNKWDLTQDLFTLSRILDLKYKLDAKETSIKEYLVIVKEAKKVVAKNKK